MAVSDVSNFKFIRDLMPKYDGNPKTLNYFIREVENIMLLLDPPARANPALVCLIKSRLSGTAIDAVAYEESLDTWQAIKNALIRRLGEPRNEIQIMQELTRVRRNKNEDSETFGKRLRDILDTLQSVGKHSDKSYYEGMVIDQYINNLDFHVSVGVRITKPITLEVAIVTARQEEARLAYNKFSNNFNSPQMQAKLKETPRMNLPTPQLSQPFRFNSPQYRFPDSNMPQRNNSTPEQRQQWVQSMVPWKNRPTSGNVTPRTSGNFRNSGNFRQQQNIPHQQVNPPQKVSDVTMRSVDKPTKPHFTQEEFFYTANEPEHAEGNYDPYCEQGECYNTQYSEQEYSEMPMGQPSYQDFHESMGQEDQS